MIKTMAKAILRTLGYEVVRESKDPERNQVNEVCRTCGVPVLECLSLDEYRRACPPLLPTATDVPSDVPRVHVPTLDRVVRNDSMTEYFSIGETPAGLTVTDDMPHSHYYSRQRMLSTVYRKFLGDSLRDVTALDIGCSSGYYSFFCARLGARSVLGIDARKEHEDQFNLLHRMLGLPPTCCYRHVDMEFELENLREAFGLVLAQGVMYHVYDHPRFIRNLFRLTGKILVLEGGCSGRSDRLCKADMEDIGYLRASIHGPVLYPSVPWMIELLRWAGFREIHYVRLPPEIPDDWGFAGLWRAMLVAVK